MAHTQTIGDYIEELEIHAGNSARFRSPRIFERC